MFYLPNTIYALVYAGDPRDALAGARHKVFDPLVDQQVYDSVRLFDDDAFEEVDRELPPVVVRAETSEGRELIRTGWTKTVSAYRSALEGVREFTEDHPDHELWMDRDVYHQYVDDFRRIGQRQGNATFLYAPDRKGIRTLPHLASVLEGDTYLQDVNDPEDFGLYVVPADVQW